LLTLAHAPQSNTFQGLTPDRVLSLVEEALAVRCTNLCRPLNSYINRVFELTTEDGAGLIAKFYRPGRWSTAALQEEHDFVDDLVRAEVPVVAPCRLTDGTTLAVVGELNFALFPKRGGRSCDEFRADQWLQLGRLLGRTHAVGATRLPRERMRMTPGGTTRQQMEAILSSDLVPRDLRDSFRGVSEAILHDIVPLFAEVEMIRIHGDCHFSNLLNRLDDAFFLIDFDDMAVGPPVQDLWMLLPGYREESLVEIALFLEGYETFRPFDRRTLALIEPLRAMRYIHYLSWCGHQVLADGCCPLVPDFGSHGYWQKEIRDLGEQHRRIREELAVG